MEIGFSNQDGIQIVAISGKLSQAEAAAVRNKLEEKINQGRSKVLFDVTGYLFEDNTSRIYLLNIIRYSLNRGALTACCGAQPSHWPYLLVEGKVQAQTFLSRAEAVDFLKKAKAPVVPIVPADKSEKKQDKTEDEIQEAIKSEALTDLLRQYAVFQQTDKDDPFRLEFFAQQFKTEPTGEALAAEKKATEALTKIADEILALESECTDLAGRVKQATIFRKSPSSEKELFLKEETLNKSVAELKTQITSNAITLEMKEQECDSAQKNFEELKTSSETEFNALQKNLEALTVETEEKIGKLKELDVTEQREFDEKKKNLSKAQS